MEKKTAEIIMICKGKHDFGEELSFKQAIAAYLSDWSACPIEFIDEKSVNNAIWEAFLDYLNGMKGQSSISFLREAKEAYDRHNNSLVKNIDRIDMYEALCIAFQMARVRNQDGYINGFTEENTSFVHKTN